MFKILYKVHTTLSMILLFLTQLLLLFYKYVKLTKNAISVQDHVSAQVSIDIQWLLAKMRKKSKSRGRRRRRLSRTKSVSVILWTLDVELLFDLSLASECDCRSL